MISSPTIAGWKFPRQTTISVIGFHKQDVDLLFIPPALRSVNRRPWGILQKYVDFSLFSGYNIKAYHASVAQSVVHLTRNEKVACSSQVTSSTKTAVFTMKTAVFRTFRGGLKDPKMAWR